MSKISIKSLLPVYLNAIIAIADQSFGQNYLTISQLIKVKDNPFSKVILLNDQPIGFCLAYPVNNLNRNELEGFTEINSLNNNAIVKQLAIATPFRGKGFGARLLLSVLKDLKQNGFETVLYPSWNESCPPYFCKKLEQTGFRIINSVSNFWYSDSIEKGYTCLICGAPPCHCSLNWYVCHTNSI